VIPRENWAEAHHLLILHGRYTCQARRPKCADCPVSDICLYYDRLQRLPPPMSGLDTSAGAYFCKTHGSYFDRPTLRTDRYGVDQIACPGCGSMNVFNSRTGKSTKQVKDYRIG
jgi:endonuclease III